jgi:hypothetical protein
MNCRRWKNSALKKHFNHGIENKRRRFDLGLWQRVEPVHIGIEVEPGTIGTFAIQVPGRHRGNKGNKIIKI